MRGRGAARPRQSAVGSKVAGWQGAGASGESQAHAAGCRGPSARLMLCANVSLKSSSEKPSSATATNARGFRKNATLKQSTSQQK